MSRCASAHAPSSPGRSGRLSPPGRALVLTGALVPLALAACGGHAHLAAAAKASGGSTAGPSSAAASTTATPAPSVGSSAGVSASATPAISPLACTAYATVVRIEAHRDQIAQASYSQQQEANSAVSSAVSAMVHAGPPSAVAAAATNLTTYPIQVSATAHAGKSAALSQDMATLRGYYAATCESVLGSAG